MKAEELRIGNWVEWEDGDKDIIEIDAVSICGGVSGMSEEGLYITEIKYINPIPLTEEWLLKFGFKFSDEEKYWIDFPNCDIILVKDVTVFNARAFSEVDGSSFFLNRIKHVHQLQNLYFALTGEELKQLEK